MKIKILIIGTILALVVLALQSGLLSKEPTLEEDIAYIEEQIDLVDDLDFIDEELSSLETFSMSEEAVEATEEIEEIDIPDFESDFNDIELEQL